MRGRAALLAAVLAVGGCGSSPTTPGSMVAPPIGNYSLSGIVVGNQDGLPIGGATVALTVFAVSHSAVTDASGRFTIDSLPGATFTLTIAAGGIVPRQSMLSLTDNRIGIALDAIRDAAPFSLSFYRQFARNGFESATLSPIRPWTVAPSFYVRTVTEDSGRPIADAVLTGVKRIIANSVPELSGGRFQAAAIEAGADLPQFRDGWVNVTFAEDGSITGGAVGLSTIGGNSGRIALLYDPNVCTTCTPVCGSLTEWGMDHEIVHAMGFYHTSGDGSEFHSGLGCSGSGRPEIARYHAAVMYTRPPGNVDPDTDRTVFYSLAVQQFGQPIVRCYLSRIK